MKTEEGIRALGNWVTTLSVECEQCHTRHTRVIPIQPSSSTAPARREQLESLPKFEPSNHYHRHIHYPRTSPHYRHPWLPQPNTRSEKKALLTFERTSRFGHHERGGSSTKMRSPSSLPRMRSVGMNRTRSYHGRTPTRV